MTEEQIQFYLANGGSVCPFCKDEAATVESVDLMESDVGAAWQDCRCPECGKEWTEEYHLMTVTLIESEGHNDCTS